MVEFRTASKGEKEHPKVIMPEEKDKIVRKLLNKEGNGFYFECKKVGLLVMIYYLCKSMSSGMLPILTKRHERTYNQTREFLQLLHRKR